MAEDAEGRPVPAKPKPGALPEHADPRPDDAEPSPRVQRGTDKAADPPPRGMLDLGNGEAMVIGTAADHRAAAEWLERNYPDGPVGEQYGPFTGPVLNMGASNALGAFRLYAGKIPPASLNVLVYMAMVALDKDPEPSWWEGHEMLAIRCLGRTPPTASPSLSKAEQADRKAILRAVERAITPLFEAGAITTTRHASGHAGHVTTVRYRLWIAQPAPDEKRRKQPASTRRKTSEAKASTRRKVVPAPDEKRRTKEEEEELKQEREEKAGVTTAGVEGAPAAVDNPAEDQDRVGGGSEGQDQVDGNVSGIVTAAAAAQARADARRKALEQRLAEITARRNAERADAATGTP